MGDFKLSVNWFAFLSYLSLTPQSSWITGLSPFYSNMDLEDYFVLISRVNSAIKAGEHLPYQQDLAQCF